MPAPTFKNSQGVEITWGYSLRQDLYFVKVIDNEKGDYLIPPGLKTLDEAIAHARKLAQTDGPTESSRIIRL